MSCEGFRADLGELLDGRLEGAERARLEAHLVTCDSCERQRARMERVIALLDDLREHEDPHLPERLLARARLRQERPASWTARRVAGWALLLTGIAWQVGGGAVAARAMGEVAPLLARARQEVARARVEGVDDELATTVGAVSNVARRSWRIAGELPGGPRAHRSETDR